MSETLNVRAARCLVWVVNEGRVLVDERHRKIIGVETAIWTSDLKFTESRDWAFLGVKEITVDETYPYGNTNNYCIGRDFGNILLDLIYKDNKITNKHKHHKQHIRRANFNPVQMLRILNASPAQITEAWVSVLEEQK